MACTGSYFAVTPAQLASLEALTTAQDRADMLDEMYSEDTCLDLDKSWSGMHRCLATIPPNGKEYVTAEDTETFGTYPLKLAIMGGRDFNIDHDASWIVCVIDQEHVAPLATAMAAIDEADFSERYAKYCRDVFPEFGEEDREYTWAYFTEARDYLQKLAGAGKAVVFLADQ